MFEIVERQEMAQGTIVSNWVKAPKIAQKAKPGQFVILRANETGERIPLTMADTDPAKGLINIIYMVVGKSTALFKTLQVGQGYLDVIGPLGQPTHLENVGKVDLRRRRHRHRRAAPHRPRPEAGRQLRLFRGRRPQQRAADHGRPDEGGLR